MAPALPTLSLAKRHAFVQRADAVRRLQQIGRDREAALLRLNTISEIQRLRGDLRYAAPHVNHIMKRDIELLMEQLKYMPRVDPGGHAHVTSIPPALRKRR